MAFNIFFYFHTETVHDYFVWVGVDLPSLHEIGDVNWGQENVLHTVAFGTTLKYIHYTTLCTFLSCFEII